MPTSCEPASSLYCGIMSGTSVDGIDVALASVEILDRSATSPRLRAVPRGHVSYPFPEVIRSAIARIRQGDPVSIAEISRLHFQLGRVYADAVEFALARWHVSRKEVAAVAMHGQTVWHAPPSSQPDETGVSSTLQLGAPAILAERLEIPIVSDFRSRDVAAGGEGAPLVPFADYVLLSDPPEARVALNIGGIANISYLAPSGTLSEVIGFDTGPGNVLLDLIASRQFGEAFDRDGLHASAGTIDQELLAEWLGHSYFCAPPPKSTGFELFGSSFLAKSSLDDRRPEDLLRTAVEFTARSIEKSIADWLPKRPERVIVSGGGVRNRFLMTKLQDALGSIPVEPIEAHGIKSEEKEALAFAILGAAALNGIPANVPAATGSAGPRLLGSITFP